MNFCKGYRLDKFPEKKAAVLGGCVLRWTGSSGVSPECVVLYIGGIR